MKGKRLYIRYLNSVLNDNLLSPSFYSFSFDIRNYTSIKNKIRTAIRLFSGHLGGTDVNSAARFRVGGTTYLHIFNKNQIWNRAPSHC